MDADERADKQREYTLEKWKVFVSFLTPVVLVVLTFVVNDALQQREALLRGKEQILAEKQKIYAELGKRLNVIYVYVDDVGDFSSYTPPEVVKMKRDTDRQFCMYLPYWSEETEKRYHEYMKAAFHTYNGAGLPAKINTSRSQKVAARSEKVTAYDVAKQEWNVTWNGYFTEKKDPEIATKYYALVSSLLKDTVNSEIHKVKH